MTLLIFQRAVEQIISFSIVDGDGGDDDDEEEERNLPSVNIERSSDVKMLEIFLSAVSVSDDIHKSLSYEMPLSSDTGNTILILVITLSNDVPSRYLRVASKGFEEQLSDLREEGTTFPSAAAKSPRVMEIFDESNVSRSWL